LTEQRAQYDKHIKLVTFSVGDYVYLKEMTVGIGKSKKFRNRWRTLSDHEAALRFKLPNSNKTRQICAGKY